MHAWNTFYHKKQTIEWLIEGGLQQREEGGFEKESNFTFFKSRLICKIVFSCFVLE